jgi:hypothetical protein
MVTVKVEPWDEIESLRTNFRKEVRFVLAARREILRDKGGILITFEEADFFSKELFPRFQREEQSVVDTIITEHLNKPPSARLPSPNDSYWTEIYSRYNGTPFTTQDSLPAYVFSDLIIGTPPPRPGPLRWLD